MYSNVFHVYKEKRNYLYHHTLNHKNESLNLMPTTARKFTINRQVWRSTKDCCHPFPGKIEFSHFYLVKRIKRTFTCKCKSRRWNVNEKQLCEQLLLLLFFWKIWLTYWRKTLNLIMLFKLNQIRFVSNSYNGIFLQIKLMLIHLTKVKKLYISTHNHIYIDNQIRIMS